MTVQELIDLLQEQPLHAQVVLAGEKDESICIEAYDVFRRRALRHHTRPSEFVTNPYGDEVVVIA